MTKAAFSIIGNLTRDPELRHTSQGTAVANFSVACNKKFKKGEDWVQETSFFPVTFFGKQAETCEKYLHKGDRVGVDGYMKQESWEKDGQKHSAIKFYGVELFFLTNKKENSGNSASHDDSQGENAGEFGDDDAVPF